MATSSEKNVAAAVAGEQRRLSAVTGADQKLHQSSSPEEHQTDSILATDVQQRRLSSSAAVQLRPPGYAEHQTASILATDVQQRRLSSSAAVQLRPPGYAAAADSQRRDSKTTTSEPQTAAEKFAHIATTLLLCSGYIAISAILINFNKYLMNHDRFPFAAPLMGVQMVVTMSCCIILFVLLPSLYPSIGRATTHFDLIAKYFPIIGVLFIVGVICSNQAYLYCNVSFLQFMKEWNIALVFFFSCLAGSQVCNRVKLFVVMWILVAASTAITGDMMFSRTGFAIQLVSQLGETAKIVFQEFVLGGSDLKLDPLTYTLFMMPIVTVALAGFNYAYWTPEITAAGKLWWQYLVANGVCAFMLNVCIAMLIKRAGAMAFILSGLVKDVVIVCVATYISGTPLNMQQGIGFTLALSGIAYWGLKDKVPENPLIRWLPKMLYSEPANPLSAEKNVEKQPTNRRSESKV